MKWYRADLHIHSVLSPCGDLDMSPVRIIREAKNKKLDIIAITDHNAAHHVPLMVDLGRREGITVIPGIEINTREEVHCLAFFDKVETIQIFQEFINNKLPSIKNNPGKFGMQLVVDENEVILNEVDNLLILALDASIEEIETRVHKLGGIFIPAHVDRPANSIFSQIGFIPENLKTEAVEISSPQNIRNIVEAGKILQRRAVITNSDAHYIEDIGKSVTEYYLEEPCFSELLKALRQVEGRKIKI